MKNLFKEFYKKGLLLLFLILILFTINAFPVIAPSDLEINSSETFFLVEITNPYNVEKDLSINFFVPTITQIQSPKTIQPNTTIKSRIFVRNDFTDFTKINSTLEIVLGEEIVKKNILTRFHPVQENNQNFLENFSGLFLFLNFENLFSESNITFFLMLVVIVLLVFLIIRISRRA